jgi:arsenate reductase
MGEIGIDIGAHRSKGLSAVPLADADVVVTLCAEEECPVARTQGRRLAWPMPDPAAPAPTDEAQRASFRMVRDLIKQRIDAFWQEQES